MKISIITVCYNSENTIRRTIESVLSQKNVDLEYIIIDGCSKDNTNNIILEYKKINTNIKYISEPDNGIYDAMNKGIALATGNIVGILNSDDYYASDDILSTVISTFNKNSIDSCYGNLVYIKKNKPYRYWIAGNSKSFQWGWMPPHPTFFAKIDVYKKFGAFRLDCGTSADYELMLRFFEKNKISTLWINKLIVYMEFGGASNVDCKALLHAYKTDIKAWKINNLKRNFLTIFLKKIVKLPQYFYAKFVKIEK